MHANNDYLVKDVSDILEQVGDYGIQVVTLLIKHWWSNKAKPTLKKIKAKVTGKKNKTDDRGIVS